MTDFAFLDSGTGGIPYLTYLRSLKPDADCVYIGDNANFPYGEKSHEQIVKCVVSAVEKIIARFDPRVIVIACNTMSVNTLDVLREIYPSKTFVGTVPAIKLASSVSKKRRIGLLATRSTVEHPYNIDLKNHFASDCELVLRADPDLISFIEHKSFTATEEECRKAIMPAVEFFEKENCDAIILGCTHFLNLAELFQKTTGDKIKIVDSRDGVAKRALSVLSELKKNEKISDDINSTLSKIPELYVTGFSEQKDKEEYDVICSRCKMKWGGLL